MKILAFDTSGDACSAAVWRNGGVAARLSEQMVRGHTEALVPMILEVLHKADCGFDTLDWLAVTIGPGSFTGIRAGLAAARGIALARELPTLGIDTFATVLWGVDQAPPNEADHRLRVIALDSRRKEIYLRIFSGPDEPVSEPEMVVPEVVATRIGNRPIVLAGSAAHDLEPVLREVGVDVLAVPGFEAPDAGDLAGLAAHQIAKRQAGDDLPKLAPLYLHAPNAVRPAGSGRLRP